MAGLGLKPYPPMFQTTTRSHGCAFGIPSECLNRDLEWQDWTAVELQSAVDNRVAASSEKKMVQRSVHSSVYQAQEAVRHNRKEEETY
jgi:hypothetical protein